MRNAALIVATAVLAACSAGEPTSPGKGTDTTGTSKAEFPILVTSQSDHAVSAATDGTNFLVFTATTAQDPLASSVANDALQLVSPTGTLLGSPVGIGSNNRRDVGFVAFDGTNYLAEVERASATGEDIYAQFVSRSGTLAGPAVAITTTHDAYLTFQVAFGGGTYLLTYGRAVPIPGDSLLEGFARTVSPNGTVGPEIQINAAGLPYDAAFGAGTFMVTYYRRGQNQHQVKVRPVSPSGIAGAETPLGPAGVGNGGQMIASNGTNFLVGWGNAIAGDSIG